MMSSVGGEQPLWPYSFHGFLRPNEDVPALPKSILAPNQIAVLRNLVWLGSAK